MAPVAGEQGNSGGGFDCRYLPWILLSGSPLPRRVGAKRSTRGANFKDCSNAQPDETAMANDVNMDSTIRRLQAYHTEDLGFNDPRFLPAPNVGAASSNGLPIS